MAKLAPHRRGSRNLYMRRNWLIILLVAALAWVTAAVVVGSPGLGLLSGSSTTSAPSGVSPSCLPATLERSAELEGLPVDVSPAPGTDTANPDTQISFLGVPLTQIHVVSVIGVHSGSHTGHLDGYSQGDGASFIPDRPFDAGERVAVQAVIGGAAGATLGTAGGGRSIAFQFRVDTPYPTTTVSEFPNPPAAPADYQSFDTMPGVQAPILSVTVPDRDPAAGDILTTNGPGPGQYGPLIYTPQGRLVWFDHLPAGRNRREPERADIRRSARPDVVEGTRARTRLRRGRRRRDELPLSDDRAHARRVTGCSADLHDFQIAPHDVAYITAFNPIRCDLSKLKGSRDGAILDTAVQEIDMKTGLVRWEWHSLDHVGASESETPAPTDTTPWDWFHINSIDVEGGDSNNPATS